MLCASAPASTACLQKALLLLNVVLVQSGPRALYHAGFRASLCDIQHTASGLTSPLLHPGPPHTHTDIHPFPWVRPSQDQSVPHPSAHQRPHAAPCAHTIFTHTTFRCRFCRHISCVTNTTLSMQGTHACKRAYTPDCTCEVCTASPGSSGIRKRTTEWRSLKQPGLCLHTCRPAGMKSTWEVTPTTTFHQHMTPPGIATHIDTILNT